MQQWRPVLGYEDCYAVSDDGQIARTATLGGKPRWKLCAPRPKRGGYITFHLCKLGQRRNPLAHRLVWEAFNGPIPSGLEINHKNSVRSDNRLVNLELMTRSENVAYGFSHNGRPAPNNPSPGSRNGSAKVTEADIPIICNRVRAGEYHYEVAADYGLTATAIRFIVIGKTWRHVPRSATSG